MSDGALASQPAHLDLKHADRESESFARSEDETAVIKESHSFEFLVRLGGGGRHTCRLYQQNGQLHGWCDCLAFRHHDPPCAHLWALIQASGDDLLDVKEITECVDPSPECPVCGAVRDGGGPA